MTTPRRMRRLAKGLVIPRQLRKWLEDGDRGEAIRHDAKRHLETEIEVFSEAAASLIVSLEEVIKAATDRNNWPNMTHMTDAEFKSDVPELLTIVEESLYKTIKNSSVEGVPAEQQNLVVDLMIQILTSVMADARKRLS
jgi:phosphopantothenate synthetase